MSEVERLRAENAELREELAAWKRFRAHEARDAEARTRVVRLSTALKIRPSGARLLLHLCSKPDHVFTHEAAARASQQQDSEDASPKTADVYISLIRPALARIGLAGAIRTHWGLGYSILKEPAATILAIAAPDQEAAA